MEITILYIRFYSSRYWFFYFKRFKFIKGIYFRVFGWNIKIMEDNATSKLIEIGKYMTRKK